MAHHHVAVLTRAKGRRSWALAVRDSATQTLQGGWDVREPLEWLRNHGWSAEMGYCVGPRRMQWPLELQDGTIALLEMPCVPDEVAGAADACEVLRRLSESTCEGDGPH